MSGYDNIEASLQDIFQGMNRFSDAQVTRGNDKIIDTMLSNQAAGDNANANCIVLYPGPFSLLAESQNRRTWQWVTYAEIFYRYQLNTGDSEQSWTEFRDMREDIIDTLMTKPQLGQTTTEIVSVFIRADQSPEEIYRKPISASSKPAFINQRLIIVTTEIEDVTYA